MPPGPAQPPYNPNDFLYNEGSPDEDMNHFIMFLKDVKKLNQKDRELLIDIVKNKRTGELVVRIDEENASEPVLLTKDMNEVQRMEEIMKNVGVMEQLLGPDEVMQDLGQQLGKLSVEFKEAH